MGEPVFARQDDAGDAQIQAPRAPRRHSPITARVISDLIALLDGTIAAGTGVITGLFYDAHVHPLSGGFPRVTGISLLGAIVFVAVSYGTRSYGLSRLRRLTHEGAALLTRWTVAILVLLATAFLIKISDATSRGWLLLWYSSGLALLMIARVTWRQLARRVFQRSPALRRRIAIVGSNEAALRVCAQMRRSHAGIEVVGVYDDDTRGERSVGIGPAGIVGSVNDLIELCRAEPIDDVLVTLPWSDEAKIENVVRRLRVLPCGIHLHPGALSAQFNFARLSLVGDTPALEVTRRSREGWATIWKVVQDRLLAGVGLLFLSPLLLVIAALIRLESPGPVLFRQRRHGFNHNIFRIYKFRTMTVCEDGDNIVQAKDKDPRITRLGGFLRRWSLDELPQLLNVLKGEMSLVGPRPHAVAHDDEYDRIIEDYSVRQRVLPGVTGWAQVKGCRGETETPAKMRERIEHDLYYVENWSPLFDLKILALTVRTVLFNSASSAKKRSCVIVVENLPVPFDRRVWQEACALRDAGWTVSVICPATKDYPLKEETIDGIDVLRHSLPVEAKGKFGFVAEYSVALWHEFRLLFRIWRRNGISVIQGCNPPDLIFLVAAPFKLLGTRFVFDHHDICPELFEVKFNKRGTLHRILSLCERLTFGMADAVISTNETFRELAMSRGGRRGEDVTSVYSYPDRARLHRVAPNADLRSGCSTVLGYVGIIGAQDGVENLIRATWLLVRNHGWNDLKTIIVGDGPAAEAARTLATDLKIGDHITFTGYLRDEALRSALSTFDIAVIPDPPNVYNDKISMNKVFEYSTLGIPTVSYRLSETERLFADTALYADDDTPEALAETINTLVVDRDLRARMAERAASRAAALFDWDREAKKYVAVFERVISHQDKTAGAPASLGIARPS